MAQSPERQAWCELPVLTREARALVRPAQRRWLLAAPAGVLLLCAWVLRLNCLIMLPDRFSFLHFRVITGDLLTLLLSVFFCCLFVLPALAGGALARERERSTLDALLFTRLSSGSIVLGKYLANLMPAGLFLLLAIPVYLAYALQAPRDIGDVSLGVLVTVSTALLVVAIGLHVSYYFRRTAIAVAVAYVAAICATLPLPLVLVLHYTAIDDMLFIALVTLTLAIHLGIDTLLVAWGLTEIWSLCTRRPVPPQAVNLCWLGVVVVGVPLLMPYLLAILIDDFNPYLLQLGSPFAAALSLSTYWEQLYPPVVQLWWQSAYINANTVPLLVWSGILAPLMGAWAVLARTARLLDLEREAGG